VSKDEKFEEFLDTLALMLANIGAGIMSTLAWIRADEITRQAHLMAEDVLTQEKRRKKP
jgi:hypothetical protein